MLFGELELPREVLLLARRDVVVTNLADGKHTFLLQVERKELHDAFGEGLRVGLLGIEAHGAVVEDPVLAGPKSLPAHERQEVVFEAADVGPRLSEPKSGLD